MIITVMVLPTGARARAGLLPLRPSSAQGCVDFGPVAPRPGWEARAGQVQPARARGARAAAVPAAGA